MDVFTEIMIIYKFISLNWLSTYCFIKNKSLNIIYEFLIAIFELTPWWYKTLFIVITYTPISFNMVWIFINQCWAPWFISSCKTIIICACIISYIIYDERENTICIQFTLLFTRMIPYVKFTCATFWNCIIVI